MPLTRLNSLAAVSLCLASLAIASEASAQILIMRSTGPVAQHLRPGTLLPATRPIRLTANDTLELLSDTSTWTWRGPGDFPAAAGAPRATALVAPDRRRARVGAVRGTPGADVERPNLWMIDVEQPGPVCVPAGDPPVLWRAEAENETSTTIAADDGLSAVVQWEAGQAVTNWPDAVPVAGGTYRLSGTADTPVEIEIWTLETLPETASETGIALIGKGCDAQLDLLAARMEPRDELAGS